VPATFHLDDFRTIKPGIEVLPSSFSLPRHRHLHPYATVVLGGTFEESGYAGRIRATAGDVLIHPALDCHGNIMVSAGVKLIRLEWFDKSGLGGFYHLDDVDTLARLAENSPRDAAIFLENLLRQKSSPTAGQANDWPDLLASSLARDSSLEIGTWAEENGLAAATVSRGFHATYGVSPATYRAELRARNAWLGVTRREEDLATIALDTGFSDQAHMTRWVHRITGAPPALWRRRSQSKSLFIATHGGHFSC
jgi:AraC-like DNA-binding protein